MVSHCGFDFQSSAHFLTGLFLLFYWRSSLYILDINSLSDVIFKYVFPFCGLPFHSVDSVFNLNLF